MILWLLLFPLRILRRYRRRILLFVLGLLALYGLLYSYSMMIFKNTIWRKIGDSYHDKIDSGDSKFRLRLLQSIIWNDAGEDATTSGNASVGIGNLNSEENSSEKFSRCRNTLQ